jgi:hypothetical protein
MQNVGQIYRRNMRLAVSAPAKSRLVQCSMLELRAGDAISFNGRGSCARHCLDTPEWSGADEDLIPVLQSPSGSASTPHDPRPMAPGEFV